MYEYKHAQAHPHGLDQVLNETAQPPWQLCAIVQTLQGALLVIVRKRLSEELGEIPVRRPALAQRALGAANGDGPSPEAALATRRLCEQCHKAPALLGFRFCTGCRPDGYEKCSKCDTDVPKGMLIPLCMACTGDNSQLPIP